MEHARKARLLAGLDRYARACDGRGRGNTAKKRQQNITQALCDQLLIGVERFALHARGRRADVVYLSYYALETNVSGGSKLSDTLIARGVFSDAAYRASRAMVNSARIG